MIPHRMVAWNGYNTAICWQLREDDISPYLHPPVPRRRARGFPPPHLRHRRDDRAARRLRHRRDLATMGARALHRRARRPDHLQVADGGARVRDRRPLLGALADLRRRSVAALHHRGVPASRRGVQAGVRPHRGRGELLRHDRRGVGEEEGVPRQADDVHRSPAGGRGRARGARRRGRRALLRGPHVCLGYWNNPEATAAALDPEGWFHTGDLARRDADGFFTIAGRKKDMFISGAVNVYPAEIEGELLLHPGRQGRGGDRCTRPYLGRGRRRVRGAESRASPNRRGACAFLAERLAKYKIPKQFVFIDALPRTPYGKVVKAELAARLQARAERGTARERLPLAHRIDGTGDTVLLLNGGMMTIVSWDAIAASLARGLPGRALRLPRAVTLAGEPHTDLTRHVEDVVALLDDLADRARPCVGTSFGAEVGSASWRRSTRSASLPRRRRGNDGPRRCVREAAGPAAGVPERCRRPQPGRLLRPASAVFYSPA